MAARSDASRAVMAAAAIMLEVPLAVVPPLTHAEIARAIDFIQTGTIGDVVEAIRRLGKTPFPEG